MNKFSNKRNSNQINTILSAKLSPKQDNIIQKADAFTDSIVGIKESIFEVDFKDRLSAIKLEKLVAI